VIRGYPDIPKFVNLIRFIYQIQKIMQTTTLKTMQTSLVTFAMSALMLYATSADAQTLIYSNAFAGSGSALNGSAVTYSSGAFGSGSVWQAGNLFLDNGQVNSLVGGSANGQAAWLPFTPTSGNIYTATVTILNNNPDWIAFGFLPALPAGGDWTATDFSVRHSNNGAYAWGLLRNSTGQSQQLFNGPGTGNGTGISGDIVSATAPVTFSIVLDTTASTWTAEYFLNGIQEGGAFDLAAGATTAIGGIGFSRTQNSTATTGGTLSDFTLTVEAAPEPSTLALCGMGLAGLFAVTHRKK
jgi:hypothetical protein